MNSVAYTDPNFNDSLDTKPRRKAGRPRKQPIAQLIDGFPTCISQSAYFNVPCVFMDIIASIDNLAELKVVMYILRHTWGFREFEAPLHITTDEFMHGRKKRDGLRMDSGTGLSKNAVLDGLERAQKHGFIECFIDDRDRARVKHYYRLKIQNEDPTDPKPPTRYFEDEDVYPGNLEPKHPHTESTEETTQQEPEQEEYSQDYDPYAGTIFSQQSRSTADREQKIFVSESEPTTTHPVVNNHIDGPSKIQRSNKRTNITNSLKKEIRIASTPEKVEEMIRFLPGADQLPKTKPKTPAFIRNMITDFSKDLGDQDHIFSNISQATRLYHDCGSTEEDFMQTLYDARATAKLATKIRHLNSHGRPNRMPYFFRCLSGVLRQETAI